LRGDDALPVATIYQSKSGILEQGFFFKTWLEFTGAGFLGLLPALMDSRLRQHQVIELLAFSEASQ
jgi:hypothetical protein